MREFKGKTAIITGGASGIGYALAERCAREKMNVVVADIQEDALSQAAHALKPICTNLLPVRTDVSRIEDVNALAKKTLETYGGVELLFNNAGVGMLGSIAGRTSQIGDG